MTLYFLTIVSYCGHSFTNNYKIARTCLRRKKNYVLPFLNDLKSDRTF